MGKSTGGSMTAKVITVFNEKGGAGKTTVAMHLGGTFALRGYKTLIADCDSAGAGSRWASTAPEDKPFPAAVVNLSHSDSRVHVEIQKHIDDYDYIVVDCPPAVEKPHASSALLVSVMAIIPCIPAILDGWMIEAAKKLVRSTQVRNEDLRAYVLANLVRLGSATLPKTVMGDLRKDKDIPLFKSQLSSRVVFAEVPAIGATVHAIPRARSAIAELDALVNEVIRKLNAGGK
jgi:chromosome partitioning protein